jgi:hypothetical protein
MYGIGRNGDIHAVSTTPYVVLVSIEAKYRTGNVIGITSSFSSYSRQESPMLNILSSVTSQVENHLLGASSQRRYRCRPDQQISKS